VLHPVGSRRGDEAQRHDEPRAAEQRCHSGRHGGQGTRHHPAPVGMWRGDHGPETGPGLVDVHSLVGNISHQCLKALETGQIGGTHLDAAHHRHRVGVRTSVVRHRDGSERHVDMNRAEAVGVGEPQNRCDHVGGGGTGGQQGLADSHGKVDDGPGCSLVNPVSTLPRCQRVSGRATVPHGMPRARTQRPARYSGGSRRTWGWGDQ
jgi:hypothetical protein